MLCRACCWRVPVVGVLGLRATGCFRRASVGRAGLASQSAVQQEGTPLFQAAGWIEPRPTPVRVAALAPGVVERLLVVEDQPVKAGEPVAELIKEDAQLAYDRAPAN